MVAIFGIDQGKVENDEVVDGDDLVSTPSTPHIPFYYTYSK
jgi:hypothetical protein